jgi:hypothetical protein
MSTLLMGLCWPLQMAPTPKAVLISLADQANDQGYCWPSIATLAERTCLCERTVRNAVRALEAMGLLRTDVGAMKSNRYVLRVREYLAGLERQRAADQAAQAAAQAAAESTARGTVDAPSVADSPRQQMPPGSRCPPAADAGEGGSSCPLTIIEPNTNTPHTPHPSGGGRVGPAESDGSVSGQGGGVEAGREKRKRGGALALETWLERCRVDGEKPVPANDPVFRYAETVGISEELIALCWREFKRRYGPTGKTQADWRRKFRNAVEGNWFGLWFVPAGEPARLSSKGEQAQRYWAAQDAGGQAA